MKIDGFIEEISPFSVSGWARCEQNPTQQLEIVIVCDGIEFKTKTKIYRQDLQGEYGFRITRDSVNYLPKILNCSVYAIHNGERVALPETLEARNQFFSKPLIGDVNNIYTSNSEPLFILGSPRSGTTAIALAVKSSTDYCGANEGWIIPIINDLKEAINYYYLKNSHELGRETMLSLTSNQSAINVVLRSVSKWIDEHYSTKKWIDKTPGPILPKLCPDLLALWPLSRFIYIQRNLAECLISKLIKFPTLPLEDHYKEWNSTRLNWALATNIIPKSSYIEINYIDLQKNKAEISDSISNLLHLNKTQKSSILNFLIERHPERTDLSDIKKISKNDLDMVSKLDPIGYRIIESKIKLKN